MFLPIVVQKCNISEGHNVWAQYKVLQNVCGLLYKVELPSYNLAYDEVIISRLTPYKKETISQVVNVITDAVEIV